MLKLPLVSSLFLISVLLVAITSCNRSSEKVQLEFTEIESLDIDKQLPVLTWTDENSESWKKESPLFNIKGDGIDLSATVRAAITKKAILFRILVEEPIHSNSETGAKIFNGSSIQIGIDVRGDGVGDLPHDAAYVGPDDGTICFALTDSGPQAWAHHINENRFPEWFDGSMPQLIRSITRDESSHTTTYDLALPWDLFQTPAGFSQYMGLSLLVNTGSDRERKQINWGRGASHIPRPGLMNRVRIETPGENVSSIITRQSELWMDGDQGEIIISLSSQDAFELHAEVAKSKQVFEISASDTQRGIRHFALRSIFAELPQEPVDFQVKLVDSQGEIVAKIIDTLQVPGQKIAKLCELAEKYKDLATHQLIKQSMDALNRAVSWEWEESLRLIREENNPSYAYRTLRYTEDILDWLNEDASVWENYLDRKFQLFTAFDSPVDGHMNLYKVRLPAGWSPDQEYPMLVFLHGSGIRHNLQFLAGDLSPKEENVALDGEMARNGSFYELLPFVGKHRYEGNGEIYVWEQINHFLDAFTIDEDRQYLSGSSMGGMGTWSLGLRTPDRWAALFINAAMPLPSDIAIGLGRNVSYLPVLIGHGENDQLIYVENAFLFRDELKKWGNDPIVKIYPGFGHGMPEGEYARSVQWLMKHKRKRPDQFTFISDSERYSGCWGITLQGDKSSEQFPGFECRIEGQTVYISSHNVTRLDIDPGENGLRMTGMVRVFLNGNEIYSGEAGLIEFDLINY